MNLRQVKYPILPPESSPITLALVRSMYRSRPKQLTVYPLPLLARGMGDIRPFKRPHSGPRGGKCRRSNKRDQGRTYSVILAGMVVVAVYGVLSTDKMPAAVQGLVDASRNLGRQNSPPAGAYYPNCHAARAAGAAPIYAGEPGYREDLDRDSDGIACEPYRGP